MLIPSKRISYVALLRRETGLPTESKRSIHEQPKTCLEKTPRLKKSILEERALVERTEPLPIGKVQKILDLKSKIKRLQHDFKFLSFGRLDDFYCMDIEELKLCFERVSHHRLWIHLSKEQIIDGIQWRAQEEFPDDPNYVRIQTRKLDYIFNSQLEDLTYETTEILREIDCLEEN
jgi:hypothetical protein